MERIYADGAGKLPFGLPQGLDGLVVFGSFGEGLAQNPISLRCELHGGIVKLDLVVVLETVARFLLWLC